MQNFVTGASGFLGGHLVEALAARGEQVRALVRPTSKIDHLKQSISEFVYGDLEDIQLLSDTAHGMDRVYHCAAHVTDWGGGWETFRATNVTGVKNLLEASVKGGVKKFIHVSTSDVYGHPNRPVDETTPYRFRGWPYGDTKIQGEQLVWNCFRQQGLPVTILRPVSIYGPRSISFVLEIVELLKSGDMVHLGTGRTPAGLAYVTNVVDMLICAADSEKSVGQAYNVCDGSDITWRQYINRLAEIVGVASPKMTISYRPAYLVGWAMEKIYGVMRIKNRPLLTRMAVEIFATDQGFPIDKARQELNYQPKVGFDEGMRRVEDWLRQIGVI
jgi:nucleoside-diphosphate-sugar epimerase